jgi:type VI protein secretion system component VasF
MPASPASPAPAPAERLRLRQAVIWTVFAALLVLGLVLWFRFGGHVRPMLDVLTER